MRLCPVCGKEIELESVRCVHCRSPLAPPHAEPRPSPPGPHLPTKKSSGCLLKGSWIFLLLNLATFALSKVGHFRDLGADILMGLYSVFLFPVMMIAAIIAFLRVGPYRTRGSVDWGIGIALVGLLVWGGLMVQWQVFER